MERINQLVSSTTYNGAGYHNTLEESQMKALKVFGAIIGIGCTCLMVACGNHQMEILMHNKGTLADSVQIAKDVCGNALDFSEDFLYGKYNEVYTRPTTGFYADNQDNPELFTVSKEFMGEYAEPSYQWSKIDKTVTSDIFTFFTSYTQMQVHTTTHSATPIEQRLELKKIKLKGILKYIENTGNTDSYYGANETEGDVFFYPLPQSMGDFPFIDVQSSSSYPVIIAGNRSDFVCAADTVKILLGNILSNTMKLNNIEISTIKKMFENSDLIEAEIVFSNLAMQYNYDAPTKCHSVVIDKISKIKDY